MLIYLRHGDDRGNDVYRHDRPLTGRGRKKARKAFGDLAEKYGHPDTLFVSPFRRAIQTLEIDSGSNNVRSGASRLTKGSLK